MSRLTVRGYPFRIGNTVVERAPRRQVDAICPDHGNQTALLDGRRVCWPCHVAQHAVVEVRVRDTRTGRVV